MARSDDAAELNSGPGQHPATAIRKGRTALRRQGSLRDSPSAIESLSGPRRKGIPSQTPGEAMPVTYPSTRPFLDALAVRGLRDADVARLLRTTRGTISRWRSGTHRPSPAHLQVLRDVLAGFEAPR